MDVSYVQHWGDDLIVVNAARVSFDKQSQWEVELIPKMSGLCPIERLSDKDTKLVNYLAKAGHTSCFEHMGATLKLKVPIFIARQIQRHRTFSYNEISRRYVDSEPEFFWPDKWRGRADNAKQGSSDEEVKIVTVDGGSGTPQSFADASLRHAVFAYKSMLESGVAPELARMVLPQNMYTEFYMSGNLRAFSHFLKLRLDSHAQVEAQQVAKLMYDILLHLFPVSMEALLKYDK